MPQPLMQFVETWQQCISQVMTQIAAKPVTVSWELAGADAIPVNGADDLWVRFRVSLGEDTELAFHIRASDAVTLARIFMGDKIDPAATLTDDSREAVAEASRQIAGRAATELKESFPGCELAYVEEPIPSWKPDAAATFGVSSEGWSFTADVFLNSELAQLLTKPAETAVEAVPTPEPSATFSSTTATNVPIPETTKPVPEPVTVAPVAPPASALKPPVNRPKRNNLDLLLDVNLAVTLRFGERQMTLHDILQLRSGSIIELDRQTDQPVDLLLDNRIIARGEVVVVDGSYGLRISQICSHNERASLLTC